MSVMKRKSKSRKEERFKTNLYPAPVLRSRRFRACHGASPGQVACFDRRIEVHKVSGFPTIDELGTDWLDCGPLAHISSLHNFYEMAACAPQLLGR